MFVSRGGGGGVSTFTLKGAGTIKLSEGTQILGRDRDDADLILRGNAGARLFLVGGSLFFDHQLWFQVTALSPMCFKLYKYVNRLHQA